MIGGFVLADSIGIGNKPDELGPRLMTGLVLLIGMGVALFMIVTGSEKPAGLIIAAQVTTVVASPLIAATLLWVTNNKKIMGEDTNGLVTNIVAGLGFLVLLLISANLVLGKILPMVLGA